ncbi:MAG: molybdenum cofactor biosynthesis protein [Blastopirellula sp.]|nr:MAG: molybdenum cofactor biosynthesis protein [Blastopirellula sp.]
MILIEEALQLIDAQASPLAPTKIAVTQSLGTVLAEDVCSDIDSPPHDKAMMDGYAILAEDLQQGKAQLKIIEEVTAGQVPTKALSSGEATRIMTGAPVPTGATAVVMIERTTVADDSPELVAINDASIVAGKNIMLQATSLKTGQVVLPKGTLIRPIEIGILSEVGRVEVLVQPRPSLAVLCTGNELVSPEIKPGPGIIRNSNGPMLSAQAQNVGAEVHYLGIGRDDEAELKSLITQGLQHDVLVLSGGVSAGVLDLVPKLLADQDVKQVFHKVSIKPGKPIWFGVKDHGDRKTLVFGLPGNPVSSMVCFELFVRQAIGKLLGRSDQALGTVKTRLAQEFTHRGNRPTLFPAKLIQQEDQKIVSPINWKGSADLGSLTNADVLIYFPGGDHVYAVDDEVDALIL